MKRAPWPLRIVVGSTLVLVLLSNASSRAQEVQEKQEKQEEEEIYECRDASGSIVYQHDPCTKARRRAPPRDDESRPKTKPARTTVKKAPAAAAHPAYRPVVVPRLDPLPPVSLPDAAQPGDPRYSTPERTWKTFVAALKSGDRRAAVDCLTSTAFAELGEAFPLEELRGAVDGFTRIEVEGQAGPFWSIRGLRPKQRPKWILFERTEAGNWKIAAI